MLSGFTMGLCKVLIVFHTMLFVSLLETSAEEPKCPMRYIEERVLEKMMSIELKSDMALEKLSDMKKKQEDEEKYAKRQTPHHLHDALRIANLEHHGWQLVFRATSGNGHNVYKAWTTGEGACDTKPTTMERSMGCHYRSSAVSEWSTLNIKMVKFAFYTRDKEVAYIIFNGQDSNSNSWFDKSRVIASSWSDLTASHSFNYFTIVGHVDVGRRLERRFFINRSYKGCDNDLGHVAVLDTGNGNVCHWDRQPSYPQFLYSQINSVDYWNARQFGRAEYLAIFIK